MTTKSEILGVRVEPGVTDTLKATAKRHGMKHAALVRWALDLVITGCITPDNTKLNGGKNENSH